MWDTVVTIAVVVAAAAWFGRRMYRNMKAKTPSCGCAGCSREGCGGIQDKPGGSACHG